MENFTKIILLTFIFFSLLFATPVCAQGVGPYLTISIGQTDVDVPYFDDGTSFSLGAGYSLNKNFALEASYIDFGESDDGIPPVWTLSADAVVLSVVGKIPFNPIVSGYAKLGFAAWDAEVEEDGFGQIFSDDGTDITYGLGILFNTAGQVLGFIQYQSYELDDIDLDNVSVGAQINF